MTYEEYKKKREEEERKEKSTTTYEEYVKAREGNTLNDRLSSLSKDYTDMTDKAMSVLVNGYSTPEQRQSAMESAKKVSKSSADYMAEADKYKAQWDAEDEARRQENQATLDAIHQLKSTWTDQPKAKDLNEEILTRDFSTYHDKTNGVRQLGNYATELQNYLTENDKVMSQFGSKEEYEEALKVYGYQQMSDDELKAERDRYIAENEQKKADATKKRDEARDAYNAFMDNPNAETDATYKQKLQEYHDLESGDIGGDYSLINSILNQRAYEAERDRYLAMDEYGATERVKAAEYKFEKARAYTRDLEQAYAEGYRNDEELQKRYSTEKNAEAELEQAKADLHEMYRAKADTYHVPDDFVVTQEMWDKYGKSLFPLGAEYNTAVLMTENTRDDEGLRKLMYFKVNGMTDYLDAYAQLYADRVNTKAGQLLGEKIKNIPEWVDYSSYALGLPMVGLHELGKAVTGEDAPIATFAADVAMGMMSAFDNAIKSATSFTRDGDRFVMSDPYSTATAYMQEDMNKVAKVIHDLAVNFGNQIPHMIVGGVTGSKFAGLATMGIQVYGGAIDDGLRMGMTTEQAREYAMIDTALEIGLEWVLGNMPGVRGVASEAVGEKLASQFKTQAAKAVMTYLGGSWGEFVEEGLQDVIAPIIQNLIMNEDIDWSDEANEQRVGDFLYAGLIGAISSIMMGGSAGVLGISNAIEEDIETRKIGKQVGSEGVEKIKGLLDAESNAGKIASQITPTSSAWDIGNAIRNAGMEISDTTFEAMKQRLIDYYDMPEEFATVTAFMAMQYANGEEITEEQKLALQNDPYTAAAMAYVLTGETTNLQEFQRVTHNIAENEFTPAEKARNAVDAQSILANAQMLQEMNNSPVFDEANQEEKTKAVENQVAKLMEQNEVVSPKSVQAFREILKTDTNFADTATQSIIAYRMGVLSNKSVEDNNGLQELTKSLSDAQRKIMYQQGQMDAIEVKSKKAKDKGGKVALPKGITYDNLSPTEKAQYDVAEVVSRATGIKIAFLPESSNSNGHYANGTVYVNLNAGTKRGESGGGGTMLFTLAHEMTHHLEQTDRKAYNELRAMVSDSIGYEKFESLVDDMMAKTFYDEKNTPIRYNRTDATAEVIANSMEQMLTDGTVIEKWAKENASTWEKIKKWFKDTIAKIQTFLNRNYLRMDEAGRVVAELNNFKEIQAFWANALSKNVEQMTNEQFTEHMAEQGVAVDMESGTAALTEERINHLKNGVNPQTSEAEVRQIASDLAKKFKIDVERTTKMVMDQMSITNLFYNPLYTYQLDFTRGRVIDEDSPIQKNSDYPQGTLDFSNICRKRLLYTAMLDALSKEHPDYVFTPQDYAEIRSVMKLEGMEVACGLCFVEDRRQMTAQIAKSFLSALNASKNGQEFFTGTDGKKVSIWKKFVDKGNSKKRVIRTALETAAKDSYVPNIYDLTTLDGMNEMKRSHPSIADAFEKFNNNRGQQAARMYQNEREYNGQIREYTAKQVKAINDAGGLRIYSFSDFIEFHALDIMQAIQDCEMQGIKIQFYTKVPQFAKMMMNTGAKGNISLIPAGKFGIRDKATRRLLSETEVKELAKKKDLSQYELAFDKVEGVDFNNPMAQEAVKTDNIGFILVGINDVQIRIAMNDPRIHFIIPYHTGQKYEARKIQKTEYWVNYRSIQTDKARNKNGNWANTKKGINIYTDVLDYAEAQGNPIQNRVEFQEAFFDACKRKGILPRFSKFLNKQNGEFVYTPGYEKLLVDFKLFDEEGNILPQRAVTADFDTDFINEMMVRYAEGEQKAKGTSSAEFRRAYEILTDRMEDKGKIYKPLEKVKQIKNADLSDAINRTFGKGTMTSEEAESAVQEALGLKRSLKDMSNKELNDTYMSVAEGYESDPTRRAEDWMSRIADEMAKRKGAITRDGKALHLYHGTRNFGFTTFEFPRGWFYATTDRTVSANYGGRDRYSAVRRIGDVRKANTLDELIRNYNRAFGEKARRVTDKDLNEHVRRITDIAKETAPKYDELLGKAENTDFYKKMVEDERIADLLYDMTYGMYMWQEMGEEYFDADKKDYAVESLKSATKRSVEARDELLEYLSEHYDEWKDTDTAPFLRYVRGYEFGDAIIDIGYASPKVDAVAVQDMADGTLAFSTEEGMRRRLEDSSASYELYGFADGKVLELDAGKRDWLSVPFEDSYHSTDYIAKWAKENGYSAVLLKNVYDGGNLADEYIFFDADQVSSADPITYDSNGNIIPLSERFNKENDDIRYSRKSTKVEGEYGQGTIVAIKGKPSDSYADHILMGSLFSGGGLLEAGLDYQMLDHEFGVEYDDNIAQVYRKNHGDHIIVGKVEDFKAAVKNLFYLHASPVCHSYSSANHNRGERQMDIDSAQATAEIVERTMPKVFTVENAPSYAKSEALKIITDKLTELGYKWDVDVYNAKDYGGATSRRRTILRAVLDGELPAKPTKVEARSWDEVTEGLIDTLPEATIPASLEKAIRATPELANVFDGVDRPLLTLQTASNGQVSYAWEGDVCPTLTTHCYEAKLFMPDGRILQPTPQFLGRIQGLPADYDYGTKKTTAYKIIGNGIPAQLTKAVMGGVIEDAYKAQTGRELHSFKEVTEDEIAKAKSHFGTTKNFNEAGYLLKDGEMLDFSGRHWVGGKRSPEFNNNRQVDHRDIKEVHQANMENEDYYSGRTRAMDDMIGSGNIRLMPEIYGISIAVMPTNQQLSKLYDFFEKGKGEWRSIDFQDKETGRVVLNRQYDEKTSTTKIINDIKQYFKDGTIPAEQSKLRNFYSYKGETAQGKKDNLDLAKQMAEDGVSNENIRLATGWFKGMDGKWRYEIDDSGAKILLDDIVAKMDKLSSGKNYTRADAKYWTLTLGEILKHDELFEAYPDIKDVQVRFERFNDGTLGQYNPTSDAIAISDSLINYNTGILDTLMHEVQHAIQEREGFAKGANPELWESRMDEERSKRSDALREKVHNLFEKLASEGAERSTLSDLYREVFNRSYSGGTNMSATESALTDKLFTQFGERWYYGSGIVHDYINAIKEEARFVRKDNRSAKSDKAFKLYRNTMGEIEARDVANRRTLTEEQRKQLPPDIYNSEAVDANNYDPNVLRYNLKSDARNYAPTFYSKLERTIQAMPSGKLSTKYLANNWGKWGVKKDELLWSGVSDYLEGKEYVTKDELKAVFDANRMQLEEITLDGESYDSNNMGDYYEAQDSFKEYAEDQAIAQGINIGFLENGEPELKVDGGSDGFDAYIEYPDGHREEFMHFDPAERATRWGLDSHPEYNLPDMENYREFLFKMPNSTYTNQAMRVHWDREGILLHARTDASQTENGDSVFFVEEVQSDWHNAGLKEGYNPRGVLASEGNAKWFETGQAVSDKFKEIFNFFKDNNLPDFSIAVTDSKDTYIDVIARIKSRYEHINSAELTILANQYWELKDQENMHWNSQRKPDAAPYADTYQDFAMKKMLRLAVEEGYDYIGWTTAEQQVKRWYEEARKAYTLEYDQQIPSFMNKFGKKFGTQVEKITLDNGETVWGMKITDSMRESVLYEGQPLFSLKEDAPTHREMLDSVLDEAVKKVGHKELLHEYLKKIDQLNRYEEKFQEIRYERARLAQERAEYNKNTKSRNKEWQANTEEYRKQIKELDKQLKNWLKYLERIDRELTEMEKQSPIRTLISMSNAEASRRTRARIEERQGVASARRRVLKHLDNFNRMLTKPSKNKFVPESMVRSVIELLETIDRSTGREREAGKAKLQNIYFEYEKLRNNDDYIAAHDPYVADGLKHLAEWISDKNIGSMTKQELDALDNVLTALNYVISNARKVINGTIPEFEGMDIREIAKSASESLPIKNGAVMQYIMAFINHTARPQTVFKALGGFEKNSVWYKLYKMLENGYAEQSRYLREADAIFHELVTNHKAELSKYGDTKYLYEIPVRDSEGKQIMLTKGMMLALYMHLQNADNTRHIILGGLNIPNMKKYYNKSKVSYADNVMYIGKTAEIRQLSDDYKAAEEKYERAIKTDNSAMKAEAEAEMDRINEALSKDTIQAEIEDIRHKILTAIDQQMTETDYKYIKAVQEYFKYSAKQLQEVNRKAYGFKKPMVEDYFPIIVDKNWLKQDIDNFGKSFEDFKVENAGFMKERVKSRKPIMLVDIVDQVNRSNRMSAQYVGFMLPIRNFEKVWQSKTNSGLTQYETTTLRGDVEKAFQAHDTYMSNIVNRLIKNLNGNSPSNMADILRSKGASAALTANLRVAGSQFASYFNAYPYLDTKALVNGMKVLHADEDEINRWTQEYWIRTQGLKTETMGEVENPQNKRIRLIKDWIASVDAFTVSRLWYACKDYISRTTNLKGDDFYIEVAKKFEEVVRNTQPMYDTVHRPDILRSDNSIVRLFTMYYTQRLQNFSMVYESIGEAVRAKSDYDKWLKANPNATETEKTAMQEAVTEANKNVAKSAGSVVASAGFLTILKTAIDLLMHKFKPYKDDDEELNFGDIAKYTGINFAESLVGNVMFGNYLWELIEASVDNKWNYSPSMGALDYAISLGKGAADFFGSFKKLFEKVDVKPLLTKSNYLAKQICQLCGIPANNINNIANMIFNWGYNIATGFEDWDEDQDWFNWTVQKIFG